ncbi:hypothetical protein [Microbacterium sp.]|uniref:hypothetical protein n=1 Tax=Microbacterium sp. TaxID=51671 RepID=UPI003F9C0C93
MSASSMLTEQRFTEYARGYAHFVEDSQRHPRISSLDRTERTLARFVHCARRGEYDTGDSEIDERQRQILDEHIPGWRVPDQRGLDAVLSAQAEEDRRRDERPRREDRGAADESFTRHVNDYARFLAEKGLPPRTAASSPDERGLAEFMRNARAKKLSSLQRQTLDEHVPGWDSTSFRLKARRTAFFRKTLNEYVEFVIDEQRRPRDLSPEPRERGLVRFHQKARAAARADTLDPAHCALLDAHFPEWNERGRRGDVPTVTPLDENKERGDQRFFRRVRDYVQFLRDEGRHPMRSMDRRLEGSLADFIADVRASAQGSGEYRIDVRRARYLDRHLPGWQSPPDLPVRDPRGHFQHSVERLIEFYTGYRRAPRPGAEDAHERRLGEWLEAAREAAAADPLTWLDEEMRDYLGTHLPGWRSDSVDVSQF